MHSLSPLTLVLSLSLSLCLSLWVSLGVALSFSLCVCVCLSRFLFFSAPSIFLSLCLCLSLSACLFFFLPAPSFSLLSHCVRVSLSTSLTLFIGISFLDEFSRRGAMGETTEVKVFRLVSRVEPHHLTQRCG